ncbi:MAG: VTT domain-containing protein [Thermoanaerobaculia bacterium]
MLRRLVQLLIHYGTALIAANVFLEQIGAPVPALPTLIVAGALTRNGALSSTAIMAAAVLSSVVADWIWFALGRRYGYTILKTLCRISLSPDSCVRDTEANFERWGMKSLLIAKFITGFSTIAPPLAGATKRSTVRFILYDGAGAFIWAGAAVAVGRLFHDTIGRILDYLENLGGWAVAIVLALFALVIVFKWWQRARFLRHLRMARITVHELKDLIDHGTNPVVLDVRTDSAKQRHKNHIPGAIVTAADDVPSRIIGVSPDSEIVLYCT